MYFRKGKFKRCNISELWMRAFNRKHLFRMPTERTLKEHMKYAHDPESAKICEKCGNKMRSQYTLKKHVQLEQSDTPRPTPVPVQANIIFIFAIKHLQMHAPLGGMFTSTKKPNESSRYKSNFKIQTFLLFVFHLKLFSLQCTMCKKAFKRPQDLRVSRVDSDTWAKVFSWVIFCYANDIIQEICRRIFQLHGFFLHFMLLNVTHTRPLICLSHHY